MGRAALAPVVLVVLRACAVPVVLVVVWVLVRPGLGLLLVRVVLVAWVVCPWAARLVVLVVRRRRTRAVGAGSTASLVWSSSLCRIRWIRVPRPGRAARRVLG